MRKILPLNYVCAGGGVGGVCSRIWVPVSVWLCPTKARNILQWEMVCEWFQNAGEGRESTQIQIFISVYLCWWQIKVQVFQTAWHLALNISEMQLYIKHVNSGCSWKPKQAWSKNFMYLANTKLWNKEHPGNFIEKQRSCCQKHEGFLAVRFIQPHLSFNHYKLFGKKCHQ